MTKINLVIASILKPIDDPRMYEKIGITLADSQKYSVHIIGFKSKNVPAYPNINFYPLFDFNRLSFRRISASLNIYKNLLKLKPEVIIIETPELLIVTIWYKIIYGSKLYYDILENYYYNILYITRYPVFAKYILGFITRAVEYLSSYFVDGFMLAEKCYLSELPFLRKKIAVLENKVSHLYKSLDNPKKQSCYHLLYSGTIAESFGIYHAINLVSKLNRLDKRFHLTIIGYCADKNEYNRFSKTIADLPFIRLIGGDYPVPHSEIMAAIHTADIGLVPYLYNRSTKDKMPTKLYEYTLYKVPMLIPGNPLWIEFCNVYNSALDIDYDRVNIKELLMAIHSTGFYRYSVNNDTLLWDKSILLGLFN
ncbi:glycosyltransferase [Rhodocytophaga aerolata]|uniref:Glycosyltransferase n=1 Tax=Rhodocytophaga aerolata TaxID=455078 RepID=A0ABT8RAQ8_9BACT|nr:glycosyltransferase [Rhodocytophaga aerolata]MDO1448766.1 glycosyltransferase [Rhodocytophaga aerolata]